MTTTILEGMTTTILEDWRIAVVITFIFDFLLVLEAVLSRTHHTSVRADNNMNTLVKLIGSFLTWWGAGSLTALILELPAFHFFYALWSWMVAVIIGLVWFPS